MESKFKFRVFFYDGQDYSTGQMVGAGEALREDYIQFDESGCLVGTDECSIIMQYTGLKDKNGREIYEGDIVRAYSWFDEDSPEYDEFTLHEVKWGGEQDYPAFDLYPAIDCGCNALQLYAAVQPEEEAIEVIGNIYENPELVSKPVEPTK